jgi:uncharacterized protein (TIGR02996 family)
LLKGQLAYRIRPKFGDSAVTHDEAFLQAMVEDPDDDTPRLVYADWLDENGQPERAEFIRIQCELAARSGPGTLLRRHLDWRRSIRREADTGFLRNLRAALEPEEQDTRSQALEQRAAALLDAHGESWRAGLPFPVEFRRGFVETVEVDVGGYLKHAATLERLAPAQAIRLTSFAPEGADEMDWEEEEAARTELLERLAACPLLQRWTDLETLACPGRDGYEALLESPHLTNLRRLVVCDNEVGPGVDLVAGPRFTNLTWLDLGNSDFDADTPGNDDFIKIVTSPYLARLEYLGFEGNRVTDEEVAALANAPTLGRLRSLCLATNEITWNGVEALAQSPHLPSLEHLDLSSGLAVGFDDRAVDALLNSPLLGRLTLLDISRNPISDAAVSRLADSPGIRRLRALAVGEGLGFLSSEGVRALAASPHLSELRRLVLPGMRLDNTVADALARSPHLANLRELVLDDGIDPTNRARRLLRERFGDGLVINEGR